MIVWCFVVFFPSLASTVHWVSPSTSYVAYLPSVSTEALVNRDYSVGVVYEPRFMVYSNTAYNLNPSIDSHACQRVPMLRSSELEEIFDWSFNFVAQADTFSYHRGIKLQSCLFFCPQEGSTQSPNCLIPALVTNQLTNGCEECSFCSTSFCSKSNSCEESLIIWLEHRCVRIWSLWLQSW